MGYFVQQFDSLQTGKYAQNYVSSYSIEHNRYNYKRGHILDKLSDILIICIIERDMALLLIINEMWLDNNFSQNYGDLLSTAK